MRIHIAEMSSGHWAVSNLPDGALSLPNFDAAIAVADTAARFFPSAPWQIEHLDGQTVVIEGVEAEVATLKLPARE